MCVRYKENKKPAIPDRRDLTEDREGNLNPYIIKKVLKISTVKKPV